MGETHVALSREDATPAGWLQVERTGSGAAVASLFGDHDMRTADDVARALDALVDEGAAVLVDLSEVTFLDSSTLHVLEAAYRRARRRGGLMVKLGKNGPVERLFRITGLIDRPHVVGGGRAAMGRALVVPRLL